MIVVGHPHTRQPPAVLERRIDRDAVGLDRQRRAVRPEEHRARELLGERTGERLTPGWRARWQTAQRERNWIPIESSVDGAAAIETSLGIGVVEVVHQPRVLHA